jgi:argininosuccinate lyase
VEDLLLRDAGEVAGNLHLARSRNDMGVTIYRMVLRGRLLQVIEGVQGLYQALCVRAEAEADTVMLAYTHTQQAQPTTLGHWLLAAADVVGRDLRRLHEAYAVVNRSPMGAAALSTSGFAIDRERVAVLLGFAGLVENSYDAIAGADYLTGAAMALLSPALDLGRVVQDFLLWSTQEFGALKVADPYVQISSIMPQKRNPVSLEHCRSLLSRVAGDAGTVLAMIHNTPFGVINDTEDDLQPRAWYAADTLAAVLRLPTAVVATMTVEREHLLERARGSFAVVTELADTLAREHGVPFRSAHRVVSALVREANRRGVADVRHIEPAWLEEAARQVLGRPLRIDAGQLRQALDPEHFVALRLVRGGVAPDEVRRMAAERRQVQAMFARWLQQERERLSAAGRALDQATAMLAAA